MRRINIYGGPGIGKSTVAAHLFARLKVCGHEVELVNEWIKSWAWQGIKPDGYDQLYIFAKQLRKEDIILRHGGIIISDSPLLLQLAYIKRYGVSGTDLYAALLDIEYAYEMKYRSLNILLKREGTYSQKGRYQNEQEANEMDQIIERQLLEVGTDFVAFYPHELDAMELHVKRGIAKEKQ